MAKPPRTRKPVPEPGQRAEPLTSGDGFGRDFWIATVLFGLIVFGLIAAMVFNPGEVAG